jgi:hypothetical protein
MTGEWSMKVQDGVNNVRCLCYVRWVLYKMVAL